MASSVSEPGDLIPDLPREELPDAVQEMLDELTVEQESIQISASSDMNLDGDFDDSWLIATNERILVLSGNHTRRPELIHDIPIADVKSAHVKTYIGNGVFEVETADKAVELFRFSRTALNKNDLADLPNAIDQLRELNGQEVEKKRRHSADHEHGRQVKRCETCGRIMRRETCSRCVEKGTLLVRLFSYLKPYWHLAVIAFVLSLITTGLSLIPTYLTKDLTDRVFVPLEPTTNAQRFYLLNVFVLAIIAAHLLNTVLGTARNYMMRWLGNKVILDLRTSAYEYLQRLSLSFYNKKETGRLMSRISHDTERLQDFIVNSIQDFVMNIFLLIGMCAILFYTNWRLAALALVPVPAIVFGSVVFGKKMHTVYHKVWRRQASISAILADTIPGVRVVKAFAAEDREVDRFNGVNQGFFQSSMHAAKLSTIYFPLMGFATFAGGVIIRWFGGRDIINEQMTLGGLMLFIGYMWRFYAPIQGMTRLNHGLQRAATAAERVFEILDAEPEVDDKQDAIELPPIQGNIKFENVVFSYDGEKNALDGVSFEAEAGQMVGLSGPSGAGKTTLINLIGRFYEVNEGNIKVDGHDIRDVTMKSLRDQISVVLQEPFLFHGSIADNIAYSKPGASRTEIVAAAKAANAHDFIMNAPDGYDTMVGERGGGLSGGERQRISIARAVLKDPRILILDEATSSVDTETEALIQSAIERLVEGRTTFAIAHRLSTLRKADKLLILEHGEIVEQGSHDELVGNDGLYKRLVDMQSQLSRLRAV